jgi:hypothetical protein
MSYTDSTTGQVIEGNAYILRSTDRGDEIVDPRRLFEGADVTALEARVTAIEAALGLADEPLTEGGLEADGDPEQGV